MLKTLESFAADRKSIINPRSLASITAKGGKRKRSQVEHEWHITTKINDLMVRKDSAREALFDNRSKRLLPNSYL
jgi:hypothetical protein